MCSISISYKINTKWRLETIYYVVFRDLINKNKSGIRGKLGMVSVEASKNPVNQDNQEADFKTNQTNKQ